MGCLLSVCGLGQLACCAGSTVCGIFSCCGVSNAPRVMYSVMLFLVTIAGWIMGLANVSNWLKNWVPWCWNQPKIPTLQERASSALQDGVNKVGSEISNIFGGAAKNASTVTAMAANGTAGTVCDEFTGYTAVYRLMFATTVFFAVLGVLMIKVKSTRDPRVPLHRGLFGIKFLLLLGLIVGAFFIPQSDGFFTTWKIFGLSGSFLFLLIQFMLIIMFADDWANDWVGRMEEEDSNSYYYSLICCTLLNFCLALTGFILFYVYYSTGASGCGLHKFFISANLVVCVALSVVSIIPKVQESQPRSGLLQASVVSLYLCYLTWSALNSSPETACKPTFLAHRSTSLDTQSFLSLVICFAAVLYSSIRLSSKSQFEKITGVSSLGNDDASVTSNTQLTGGGGGADGDDDEDTSNWSYFYFIFALGTLYLMMTLTNWYSPTESQQTFGQSSSSLWIKMSSSWICAFLYLWTLVAPILLGQWRDFS